MLSDETVKKIVEYYDAQLGLIDAEQTKDLMEFYSSVNYYSVLRDSLLDHLFSTYIAKEPIQSIIFDTLPRILFLFSKEELGQLTQRIAESFVFWSIPSAGNTQPISPVANPAFMDETFFEQSYLVRKLNQERWILNLCLFFLYFHKTRFYEETLAALKKQSQKSH